MAATKLPDGIREAALQHIAADPDAGRHAEAIAKHWGISVTTVRSLMRSTPEIQELRQAAAGRMLELAVKAQDVLAKDLDDELVMFQTSAKDKAFIAKAVSDAAVTLIEGVPQTNVQLNFGDLKRVARSLEARTQRRKPVVLDAEETPSTENPL